MTDLESNIYNTDNPFVVKGPPLIVFAVISYIPGECFFLLGCGLHETTTKTTNIYETKNYEKLFVLKSLIPNDVSFYHNLTGLG